MVKKVFMNNLKMTSFPTWSKLKFRPTKSLKKIKSPNQKRLSKISSNRNFNKVKWTNFRKSFKTSHPKINKTSLPNTINLTKTFLNKKLLMTCWTRPSMIFSIILNQSKLWSSATTNPSIWMMKKKWKKQCLETTHHWTFLNCKNALSWLAKTVSWIGDVWPGKKRKSIWRQR
jgi:hypothetical protein